jgi:Na+-transporting methylmalonyl-CoA/oxaloacetate decarboxylase gamma subunit
MADKPKTITGTAEVALGAATIKATGEVARGAGVRRHGYAPDEVVMRPFELLNAIREARDEMRTKPPGSWVITAFSVFLALVLDLVSTSKYGTAFGLPSAAWNGVILGLAVVMAFVTVVVAVLWLASTSTRRSEREIVQGIIDEMRSTQETGRIWPPAYPQRRPWWWKFWRWRMVRR